MENWTCKSGDGRPTAPLRLRLDALSFGDLFEEGVAALREIGVIE